MKASLLLIGLFGLTLAAVVAPQLSAQITNPGFETGSFAGWQISTGARASVVKTATDYPVDPFTLDLDFTRPYTVNPAGGNYFARLEAGATRLDATETFLGLSAGALSNSTNNPFGLSDAAAVAQTVSLQAGDTYLFNWNFFAVDVPGVGDDFAFFTASNSSGSIVKILSTVSGVGNGKGTGWMQVPFTAGTSDTYRLGFGVANFGDNTINSILYIDPLRVGAVPEASTYGLIGALACLGLIVRRLRPTP